MHKLNRRDVILGTGATALTTMLSPRQSFGLDIGSWFSNLPTAVGAAAVGLFPGGATALGGFELIKVLGQASDLEKSAGNLIAQTQALESHMDSVLTQVSATLNIVQTFVQDCDQALHDIEDLIRQLPNELAAAFDQVAAKQAFARLRGDCINMAAMLNSKGSIQANLTNIESLSRKIVTDITTVDALAPNMIQCVTQMTPALSVWVQGYSAYNLFRPQDQRETDPWSHQIVKNIALPKFKTLFDTIKQHSSAADDAGSKLTLEPNTVYKFDGSGFVKSSTSFAASYNAGEIDDDSYYAIWPDNVPYPISPPIPGAPPGAFRPGGPPAIALAKAGDLCFLMDAAGGPRYWEAVFTFHPYEPRPYVEPKSLIAEQVVAVKYPHLMASAIGDLVAFHQITSGWELLETSVNSHLRDNPNKDVWEKLPTLPASK